MKKHSLMSRNMGIYSSPGTPDYHDGNVGGIQKGWNSERVPLPSNSSRRHINAAALMPFNSGRTLPSKWDDAERWITSPVSGLGVSRPLPQQPQRRPKSKSGPIGGPGVDSFSNYSPAPQVLQGGSVRDFMAGSPFTTGVLVPDAMSIQYGGHNVVQSSLVHTGTAMGRTASLLGWSDTLTESSSPSSRDEKLDGTKDAETTVSRAVSRRDMATQMSPADSTRSSATSPEDRLSFSTSPPSILPVLEPYNNHSAKLEIRDVQVDKRVTVTRQSGKHGARMKQNESPVVEDLTSTWDISKATRDISKLQKEEAKIAAWENLQKAKAEAAVRKLEVNICKCCNDVPYISMFQGPLLTTIYVQMRLEKKKSASMDKILKKLRKSQMKAQEMRGSMPDSYVDSEPNTTHEASFVHKLVKICSLRGCYSFHA
ncbi:hypothetical protein C3L33_18438, partial [Rhododendron williamsianum]